MCCAYVLKVYVQQHVCLSVCTFTSHPLSHYKTYPHHKNLKFLESHDQKFALATSLHCWSSSPLHSSHFAISDFAALSSSRRSQSTVRNVSGIRLPPHPILNVSICFRSTLTLNAFMPMSAVLCIRVRFRRISSDFTHSCDQSTTQSTCGICPSQQNRWLHQEHTAQHLHENNRHVFRSRRSTSDSCVKL